MTTAVRTMPDHGTEGRYKGTQQRPGCRCATCIHGWNKAHQRRALDRLEGRPPKIPAAPVTRHIQDLTDSGLTITQIAHAAGIDRNTVADHAAGKFTVIRRTSADRILTVRPHHRPTRGYIDALGTRRRIQTLYAAGHGVTRIAATSHSLSDRTLDYILRGERTTVTTATADAVTAAYNILAAQPGPSARARRRALAQGWPGPDYWDPEAFDNPDFTPAITDTPKYMRLGEDGLWLKEQGYTRHQVANRLGETVDYIDHSIRRYLDAIASQAAA